MLQKGVTSLNIKGWQFHELKSLRINLLLRKNRKTKQQNGPRHYLWSILDDFHPQQMHKSSEVKALENC